MKISLVLITIQSEVNVFRFFTRLQVGEVVTTIPSKLDTYISDV